MLYLRCLRPSLVASLAVVVLARTAVAQQEGKRWLIHDFDRPTPTVVTPGATAGGAPSDAIVLFDGSGLGEWMSTEGGAPGWTLRDGYMETRPGAGALRSKRGFGDIQLHIEWATPAEARGEGQDRGNSGVIIMGRYEVQVLDSYQNRTYADGQAGAVYGQYAPLVNASRKPGEWQAYDIVFRRPRFAANGRLVQPATMTVLHNGVLLHDKVALWGGTDWLQYAPYAKHDDALPLTLQDHDHPVRYRNVWVRELPDAMPPRAPLARTARARVSLATLRQYAGKYEGPEKGGEVHLRDGVLVLQLSGTPRLLPLVPTSPTHFEMRHTAGTVDFSRTADGGTRLTMRAAGAERTLVKRP